MGGTVKRILDAYSLFRLYRYGGNTVLWSLKTAFFYLFK